MLSMHKHSTNWHTLFEKANSVEFLGKLGITGNLDVRHLTLPTGDEKLNTDEEFQTEDRLEDKLRGIEKREIVNDVRKLEL